MIEQEIAGVYEEIIQLEQAMIELDEQNTQNAIEVKKREAKVILLAHQMEDLDDIQRDGDDEGEDVAAEREELGK